MNKDIYEWLNNNNNKQLTNNNKNNGTTLIECILIISINGILIEYQSLINYCNGVINNSDNNEMSSSSPSSYCGLSKQQFQTIYNNINNIYNSTTITLNDNPKEYINSSNKIKFNSSISIISENNKFILNKQQQHDSNTTTTTTTSLVSYNNNKKIKSCNCNGTNSRDIDITFYQVWRNIVIRNEILFHTRLYNLHLVEQIVLNFEELSTYKYRGYLDKLEIRENSMDIPDQYYELKPNLIPYGVSEIKFYCNVTLQVNSIPSSVTSILFFCKVNPTLVKGMLPDSITSLEFNKSIPDQSSLSLDWLPCSLLSLEMGRSFQCDIEPGQLPQSLTELILHNNYDGKILEGSISLAAIANSFHFKFDSNKLSCRSIPISTTSLEFDYYFDEPIKPGDIPHNVIDIKLPSLFNSEIQVGSLPLSLKSLSLGNFCKQSIGANVLPSNLTYIDMDKFNQPLAPNLFPQSITSIKMRFFDNEIPVGYFYNYTNLKSLEISSFFEVIPEKTLPPSLTLLDLGIEYDSKINYNALPESLTTFKTGHLNIEGQTTLPSITSLSIHSEHLIPPGLLPCNLLELYIGHLDFNQHLSFESFEQGILPRSLHSIYIYRNNTYLVNSLDTLFLYKYIKFIN